MAAGSAGSSARSDRIQGGARHASGDLKTQYPRGSDDERATLLTAMGTMRDNIRMTMERELAQRRSAQARPHRCSSRDRAKGRCCTTPTAGLHWRTPRASEFTDKPPQASAVQFAAAAGRLSGNERRWLWRSGQRSPTCRTADGARVSRKRNPGRGRYCRLQRHQRAQAAGSRAARDKPCGARCRAEEHVAGVVLI